VSFTYKELPKVNNHPLGEKSPNLVTLTATEEIGAMRREIESRQSFKH
jgi:hypothetical protein